MIIERIEKWSTFTTQAASQERKNLHAYDILYKTFFDEPGKMSAKPSGINGDNLSRYVLTPVSTSSDDCIPPAQNVVDEPRRVYIMINTQSINTQSIHP